MKTVRILLLGLAACIAPSSWGQAPWSGSAADFVSTIKSDIEGWKKVAKDANIKAE